MWQFWVDVGGTFTDCVARDPAGVVRMHKLLSSGVYKSTIQKKTTPSSLQLSDRGGDPDGFFVGWNIRLVESGVDWQTTVTGFTAATGRLECAEPVPDTVSEGQRCELFCSLEAPVIGIRWLMNKPLPQSIGPVEVRLGTTRGTNALLERMGAKTGLVTTRGFGDALRIAYQDRPSLFALEVRKPQQLYSLVVEVDERLDSTGAIERPPDPEQVRELLAQLKDQGIESLAVCLLHSYRNPDHEQIVKRVAGELGFANVSISSELTPLQKLVSRGDTTVVDAYLTPIIHDYISGIRRELPEAKLRLMTSAGALVEAASFVGKDSVLSGPAGGVVGYAYAAGRAGMAKAIGFDMGGTSTDVSRFDGEYERRYEMEVNDPESGTGVRIVAPMMSIETVAAGGGSICGFDGQKPTVGPQSAGADPGPACYGRGGPLTVTDVNLLLGRILPEFFPFPLDYGAVCARIDQLRDDIARRTGSDYSREQLAEGYVRIANANMVAPVKKISIARGYDIREYALVAFGGAGPQHACAVAADLGIRTILLHPLGGVLSAFGIGMANVSRFAARDVGMTLDQALESAGARDSTDGNLEPLFVEMEDGLRGELAAEGIESLDLQTPKRYLDLRYQGQDTTITIRRPDDGNYRSEFERQHRQLYGFTFPERAVEVYAARVELVGETAKADLPELLPSEADLKPIKRQPVRFAGKWQETPVFRRDQLAPGHSISGPAIILEQISTIVVEPDWHLTVNSRGDLVLETRDVETAARRADSAAADDADPITLELFNNHFASIAEQMGSTLQKTALSTNVKERLDFSCAIFDQRGELVVNAPHIPVHLGAMSQCVQCLMEDVPQMVPGEVFVTNDPFRGGSHLPDVTVVTPVFLSGAETPAFYTASRAHHAEIGGVTPGSMPPFSKSLAEEGVLIRCFRLVHGDQSSERELRELLTSSPYPTRSVHENIADINAQVAANQSGVTQLLAMVDRYHHEVVQAYMGHIQRAAERKTRLALEKIAEGRHEFSDVLDDGSRIQVAINVAHSGAAGAEAVLDFQGTDPTLSGNLNANHAITSSAVIYCFRCLIDEPIPLNAGVLIPLRILIPEGTLLSPRPSADPRQSPAVVGGNVETSQRIVDVILGALGVVAASQGTMNNFLFGRTATTGPAHAPGKIGRGYQVDSPNHLPGFGYYETICGGTGAGPGFHGADAVHSHMTNTRLTDPEVLEDRYPVRLRRFAIRPDSGGHGLFRGGNGIIREIEFLESVEVSLLTSRRRCPPYGANGGDPGKPGVNWLVRNGEAARELEPSDQLTVNPGDVICIETPGGGGWGNPT